LAVARLPSGLRAVYSPCVGLRGLATGVRAAGGVRGLRDGPARDWCRRAMVTHRVVAWVAASAALYACALMVASTRQPDALSPAGVTMPAASLAPHWRAGRLLRRGMCLPSHQAAGRLCDHAEIVRLEQPGHAFGCPAGQRGRPLLGIEDSRLAPVTPERAELLTQPRGR
jgi:hypothetical protein